jgi:hypothetical protein
MDCKDMVKNQSPRQTTPGLWALSNRRTEPPL